MKLSDHPVVIDDELPDGRLQGFSRDGVLVVEMEFSPIFRYLVGNRDVEIAVTEWRISAAHARRIAAQAAWQLHDYKCKGGVQ